MPPQAGRSARATRLILTVAGRAEPLEMGGLPEGETGEALLAGITSRVRAASPTFRMLERRRQRDERKASQSRGAGS